MEKFVTMDFPVEQIRLTPLMRDEEALAAIRAISPDAPTPEKIRQVYGDVYFPRRPQTGPICLPRL